MTIREAMLSAARLPVLGMLYLSDGPGHRRLPGRAKQPF